jgi:hypothetical protein
MDRQVIELDSFRHYRVRRTPDGLIEVLEHPARPCPAMDEGEVDREGGMVIATLKEGEEAEFVLGRFAAAVPPEAFASVRDIWCGDDFIQLLRGDWKRREGKAVRS